MLLGQKDLYFKIYVKNASGLPVENNRNVYITYQFDFGDEHEYKTEIFEGCSSKPNFDYEFLHRIKKIDEEVVDELVDGSISFSVYGYPPLEEEEKTEKSVPVANSVETIDENTQFLADLEN